MRSSLPRLCPPPVVAAACVVVLAAVALAAATSAGLASAVVARPDPVHPERVFVASPSARSSAASAAASPSGPAFPSPEVGRRVYDFAKALGPAAIAAAEQSIALIESGSGVQIVVVTWPAGRAPTSAEAEADAARLLDEWRVGGPAGNGLVIFYDLDPSLSGGQVVIRPGQGLAEAGLPDDARRQILESQVLPAFESGDLAGSLNGALVALTTQLVPAAVVSGTASPPPGATAVPSSSGHSTADAGGAALPLVVVFMVAAVVIGLAIAYGSGARARQGASLGAAVTRRRRTAPLQLTTAQRDTAASLRRLMGAGVVEVPRQDGRLSGVRVLKDVAEKPDLDDQAAALLDRLTGAADPTGLVLPAAMPQPFDRHRAARDAFEGRRPRNAIGDWAWWWPVVLLAAEPEEYARAVADLAAPDAASEPPAGEPRAGG